MLLRKEGFPEENDLVMSTITKIHYHSVFVNIDEYGRSGMIHISEISPGRIRNIRDYVVEGKVVVCKVLRIDTEKGHIDLSLRRVTEAQRRAKINEIKQEQKAEKILEFVAKQLKVDLHVLYDEVHTAVKQKYELLSSCFEDVALRQGDLSKLGIDQKYLEPLTTAIKQRIKPPEVHLKSVFMIQSFEPDGVKIVKDALSKAKEKSDGKAKIIYLGGGKYDVDITVPEYKEGEKILEGMVSVTERYMQKHEGAFSNERRYG
jgi:translation initiation factor 2 subunit 1